MEGLRITKLTRHDDGDKLSPYYTANVTLNGLTIAVTSIFGSWMTEPTRHGTIEMKDIHPAVAAELQKKVKRIENARKGNAGDNDQTDQPEPESA